MAIIYTGTSLSYPVASGCTLVIKDLSGTATVTGAGVKEDASASIGAGFSVYGPQSSDVTAVITTTGQCEYHVVQGDATGSRDPVLVDKASGLITDPSARTAVAEAALVAAYHARPRLGVFGCSIAQQSGLFLHSATSTTSGVNKAGQKVINVANGALFSNGDKIATMLYNGRTWRTTISSISTNALTVADNLPGMIRAGTSVKTFTTPTILQLDQDWGLASAANAMLGGPADLLPAYGYGGANSSQMIADLRGYLAYYRPSHIALHLFENDMVDTTISLERCLTYGRMAAKLCLQYAAIPIMFSSQPYNLIPASQASKFDDLLAWVNQIATEIPGAVGIDASTKWLDTSNPTYPRSPTSGLTDGVHLNTDKRFYGARLVAKDAFSALFGTRDSIGVEALTPVGVTTLTGTGGSQSNLQAGSIAPASYTLAAYSSTTATTSRNSDGSLRVVLSWAGASTESSTYFFAGYTWTPPDAVIAGGQWMKAYVKVKATAITDMSRISIELAPSTGENHVAMGAANLSRSMESGETYVLHTPAVQLGVGVTSVGVNFTAKPATLSSPSTAAATLDIYEMGVVTADGEMPLWTATI